MIKELTISPEFGGSLSLSIPEGGDGYQIRRMDGLGPVPVTVSSTSIARTDARQFQHSRKEVRNIILTIKLDSLYTGSSIEARRHYLYSLLLSRQSVTLRFDTTKFGPVEIVGHVEDIEDDIFSSDTVMAVTFLCLDPDFKSTTTNELATEIHKTNVHTLDYKGNTPTGVVITLDRAPGSGRGDATFEFSRTDTGKNVGYILTQGNHSTSRSQIYSSLFGDKQLRWVSNLSEGSFFRDVHYDSLVWPVLNPGETNVRFHTQRTSVASGWGVTMEWVDRYGAL